MDFETFLIKLLAHPVGGGITLFIFLPMGICLLLKWMIMWKESSLPYITISFRKRLNSTALDHEGLCIPTWVNTNQVITRLEGIFGFFRSAYMIFPCVYILHGKMFHGKVARNDEGEIELWTTRYLYDGYYSYDVDQLVDGEDVYWKRFYKPQPHLQRLADAGA